mmetsp:Transcript_10226/g.16751  ORF Transcript_10226/g.16751 Transcript_10226/m.16751 type:complete len:164 (+) Transcript_10226:78-569(+)
MLRRVSILRSAVPPTLDWLGLASKLSTPEAKDELSKLRKAYDDLNKQLASTPKEETIDWNYFYANINDKSVVDKHKKAFDELVVPDIKDNVIEEMNKEFVAVRKQAQELQDVATVRIKDIEANLDQLRNMKPLEQVTVDEFLAANPYIKEKVDKDIEERNWVV